MITYTILKIIHIGSLIFWIGPALGAWLVLKYAQNQHGENANSTSLIYKVFFLTLTIEHFAFVTLLTSGALLAYTYNFWGMDWLNQKLIFVFAILIPLEIVDIWLGNWKVNKLIALRNSGTILTESQKKMVGFYHKTFTNFAILILPLSVLIIMWLAISKFPIV